MCSVVFCCDFVCCVLSLVVFDAIRLCRSFVLFRRLKRPCFVCMGCFSLCLYVAMLRYVCVRLCVWLCAFVRVFVFHSDSFWVTSYTWIALCIASFCAFMLVVLCIGSVPCVSLVFIMCMSLPFLFYVCLINCWNCPNVIRLLFMFVDSVFCVRLPLLHSYVWLVLVLAISISVATVCLGLFIVVHCASFCFVAVFMCSSKCMYACGSCSVLIVSDVSVFFIVIFNARSWYSMRCLMLCMRIPIVFGISCSLFDNVPSFFR